MPSPHGMLKRAAPQRPQVASRGPTVLTKSLSDRGYHERTHQVPLSRALVLFTAAAAGAQTIPSPPSRSGTPKSGAGSIALKAEKEGVGRGSMRRSSSPIATNAPWRAVGISKNINLLVHHQPDLPSTRNCREAVPGQDRRQIEAPSARENEEYLFDRGKLVLISTASNMR